jgi:hypothetical protein
MIRDATEDETMSKYQSMIGRTIPGVGRVAEPEPGSVFDPMPLFFDPQELPLALAFFRRRASRDGVGAGLSNDERAAALDEAAQRGLRLFLDRDYSRSGLTAACRVAAYLSAAAYMRRAQWREGSHGREYDRGRKARGNAALYNRAAGSRAGHSPAAIYHAARGSAEDMAALVGTGCDDIPGEAVTIPGGPSGRGATDGKMERVETVARDRIETDDTGRRWQVTETVTGWRMARGRGRASTLPPATVNAGRPAPLARFVRQPLPNDRRPCRDENRTTDKPAGDWFPAGQGAWWNPRGVADIGG